MDWCSSSSIWTEPELIGSLSFPLVRHCCCHVQTQQEQSRVEVRLGRDAKGCWRPGAWRMEPWPHRGEHTRTTGPLHLKQKQIGSRQSRRFASAFPVRVKATNLPSVFVNSVCLLAMLCYVTTQMFAASWVSSFSLHCCSPVQRLGLRGGLLSGGGPSGPQRGARHWRVLLRLRLPGWEQLQPSPARFPPSQRLPLWRRRPRYQDRFCQSGPVCHLKVDLDDVTRVIRMTERVATFQSLTGFGTATVDRQRRYWAARTEKWTSTPITAVAQQRSGAPESWLKGSTSGRLRWRLRCTEPTW